MFFSCTNNCMQLLVLHLRIIVTNHESFCSNSKLNYKIWTQIDGLKTTHLLKTGVLRNWRGETETAPFISAASHDSHSNSRVTFIIFIFAFFLNYVQHSTNIRDTFFPYFKCQRIQKKIIVHQFHGQPPQNKRTK